MIVTIIGSLSKRSSMEDIKNHFESIGAKVNWPFDKTLKENRLGLLGVQMDYYDKIKEADLIVAVSKYVYINIDDAEKDTTSLTVKFGESTSYEMAIAYKLGKSVVVV